MANQLNSAQGMDPKSLKKGQVILRRVIATSNPDIISVELWEGGIENTSRNSTASGQIDAINVMMTGYKGFNRTAGVNVCYQTTTHQNLTDMLGIDGLDLQNAIFTPFQTKSGGTKEGYTLDILDPVMVYNPHTNEDLSANPVRFRVMIDETTNISKDKYTWAEKQGIFDEREQVNAIVEKFAKTAGDGGDVIRHNGLPVFRNRKFTFAEANATVLHTFLKSDPPAPATERVDVSTGEIVQEYSEDLA
tara:strand:+ start:127 stop:870 length:744 start_codon:yes stop_codon:yes gene_type:complete